MCSAWKARDKQDEMEYGGWGGRRRGHLCFYGKIMLDIFNVLWDCLCSFFFYEDVNRNPISCLTQLQRLSIIVSVDFLIFNISFWCTLPVIHKHKRNNTQSYFFF